VQFNVRLYCSTVAGVGTGGVVVLVVALVAGLAVIATVLTLWLRSRFRAAAARLAALLVGEPAIRGPEPGVYRGCTAGYSSVDGNGRIALTAQRLLFQKGVGSLVEVRLADVTEVTIQKVFNRSVVGTRTHLVVHTRLGDVGYFVNDTQAWREAVERAAAHASAKD
jgi:hypothetical protein